MTGWEMLAAIHFYRFLCGQREYYFFMVRQGIERAEEIHWESINRYPDYQKSAVHLYAEC